MSKQRAAADQIPPCYALVVPGLESIAAEEITKDFGGEVKRTSQGLVVFRVPEIDKTLLRLRTVEDVFLFAWGSDTLTYRAEDLKSIRRWTDRAADWNRLLRLHHSIRPKPKGKPSYHLVTQMLGHHGYRRIDAAKALAQGLKDKLPASWRPVNENAAVEIWLTIYGATAICGVRLSDATMRHRTYKQEHVPASLRPTVAAAMVRLAEPRSSQILLDPMCGAGTILAETIDYARRQRIRSLHLWGGDRELAALRATQSNLLRLGQVELARWDATQLPLADGSVDHIVSNPPFGKQLASPREIGPLYRRMVPEYDRVLRSGGTSVVLVSEFGPLKEATRNAGWKLLRQLDVRVLGQKAYITVWRKKEGLAKIQRSEVPPGL